MRVYRVFPHTESAKPGEPGHATYVPTVQGGGRLDNPGVYTVRYFAESGAGAVAERFGELATWLPAMFNQPGGRRLALATFELTNAVRVLELDDAQALVARNLRPTQVVRRDHEVTQAWALNIHNESIGTGAKRRPRWDGVRWWSWYRPEWPIVGLWGGDVELIDVQRLDFDHTAVRDAATTLAKPLDR